MTQYLVFKPQQINYRDEEKGSPQWPSHRAQIQQYIQLNECQ